MRDLPVSLGDFKKSIDELVNSFWGVENNEKEREKVLYPRTDIIELEKEVKINVELPGIKKDDIKISVDNNLLKVSGEKKDYYEEKDREVLYKECSVGIFERTFTLPSYLDVEKIDVQLKDGVLMISIPKKDKMLPKEIEIK